MTVVDCHAVGPVQRIRARRAGAAVREAALKIRLSQHEIGRLV
jgi:hypothetical protein